MAQKFVKATGLHNVFDVSTSGTALDITSINSSAQSKVNQNSIVFLTATSDDEQYGYSEGSKYIWTHSELYPTNDPIVNSIVGETGISERANDEFVAISASNPDINGKITLDASVQLAVDVTIPSGTDHETPTGLATDGWVKDFLTWEVIGKN